MANLIISLFLLIHVITDFYIQNDDMVEKKRTNNRVIAFHAIHVLVCSLPLLLVFGITTVYSILFISFAHLIIDKSKVYLESKNNVHECFMFILDQMAHITIIILTYPFLSSITSFTKTFMSLSSFIMENYPFLSFMQNIELVTFIVLLITSLLFLIRGATFLTLQILDLPNFRIKYKEPTDHELDAATREVAATASETVFTTANGDKSQVLLRANYGKIIGNIERLIIVISILLNSYELIIGIIAIKSIGRFKELDEGKIGDYYIVGTLASYTIAITIGLLLNVYYKSILL